MSDEYAGMTDREIEELREITGDVIFREEVAGDAVVREADRNRPTAAGKGSRSVTSEAVARREAGR